MDIDRTTALSLTHFNRNLKGAKYECALTFRINCSQSLPVAEIFAPLQSSTIRDSALDPRISMPSRRADTALHDGPHERVSLPGIQVSRLSLPTISEERAASYSSYLPLKDPSVWPTVGQCPPLGRSLDAENFFLRSSCFVGFNSAPCMYFRTFGPQCSSVAILISSSEGIGKMATVATNFLSTMAIRDSAESHVRSIPSPAFEFSGQQVRPTRTRRGPVI